MTCTICQEQYQQGNTIVTKCGHIYHKSCINEWLSKSNNKKCPLCNNKLDKSNFITIYQDLNSDVVTSTADSKPSSFASRVALKANLEEEYQVKHAELASSVEHYKKVVNDKDIQIQLLNNKIINLNSSLGFLKTHNTQLEKTNTTLVNKIKKLEQKIRLSQFQFTLAHNDDSELSNIKALALSLKNEVEALRKENTWLKESHKQEEERNRKLHIINRRNKRDLTENLNTPKSPNKKVRSTDTIVVDLCTPCSTPKIKRSRDVSELLGCISLDGC